MEKIKLKSGLEVEIKEISLDDEADVVDTMKKKIDKDGTVIFEAEETAMLKYLRLNFNGKGDDYIRTLSYVDKAELFQRFINSYLMGEGKASSSN